MLPLPHALLTQFSSARSEDTALRPQVQRHVAARRERRREQLRHGRLRRHLLPPRRGRRNRADVARARTLGPAGQRPVQRFTRAHEIRASILPVRGIEIPYLPASGPGLIQVELISVAQGIHRLLLGQSRRDILPRCARGLPLPLCARPIGLYKPDGVLRLPRRRAGRDRGRAGGPFDDGNHRRAADQDLCG